MSSYHAILGLYLPVIQYFKDQSKQTMENITHIHKQLRDACDYWRLFSRPDYIDKRYDVLKIGEEHAKELIDAKKLHVDVYLSRDFISHTDVLDGVMHLDADPHQEHSDYFVVQREGDVVGLARQIVYKGRGKHHESFPVLEKAHIHKRSINRILNHHPTEIVEISALVKKSGESTVVPLLLYRALWFHSWDAKHRLWVMACDVRLYQRLKMLFGPALTVIGRRTPYQGGDVIPVALDVTRGKNYMHKLASAKRRDVLDIRRRAARFMAGLPD